MAVSVVRDPRFGDHDPGEGHPESPARYRSVARAVDEAEALEILDIPARLATREELTAIHQAEHVDHVLRLRGQSAALDPDTYTSPGSVDAACLAAGGAIDLAVAVADGKAPPGIALVRPPGHHAIPGRAMGFCLMNNVAAAAQALLQTGRAERVAIYDWDVHHGNGTQAIFYDDPRVLYMSTHQWPFYPGTGAARETGRGAGEGTTVNLPLPAGTDDEALLAASEDVLMPRVRAFAPDFILISAGFDPLVSDPVGGFRVTRAGFEALAARWRAFAESQCGGRIAAVLEGGYDTDMLGALVVDLMRAWDT
ncbi:MAG: histone deacetylase [Myxococcales bacterium]|nr:histone deacetylase [Myxococcales bacterium]